MDVFVGKMRERSEKGAVVCAVALFQLLDHGCFHKPGDVPGTEGEMLYMLLHYGLRRQTAGQITG